MIQSIAIQAYFDRMRHFLSRQGFDPTMKIAYGADAEGAQRLLDQDIADKDMDRKSQSNATTMRSKPYSYIFWNRDSLVNTVRRPVKLRDGITEDGRRHFKKTTSASFGMGCVLVSNKANLIEDFAEAFAAEYQNLHNIPINLKFAYDDRNPISAGGFDTEGMSITVIQDLGTEELVSYRTGDLFSYSWNLKIYLTVVSEFADFVATPIRNVIVDLYNPQGVPLASMDFNGSPKWTTHTAPSGEVLDVPQVPFVEHP